MRARLLIAVLISFMIISSNLVLADCLWDGSQNDPCYTMGRVGIGTTNPLERFSLFGNGSTSIIFGIRGEYNNITLDGTNYYKQMEIAEPRYNIPYDVTDNGYRVGLAIQGYANTSDFQGTLKSQISAWIRAGAYSNSPGGTINKSYAILIDNLEGGTQIDEAFGIYQVSKNAKNYFGGNVGIGDSSPKSNLVVSNPNPGVGSSVLFVTDEGSSIPVTTATTARIANNGGSSTSSVLEVSSGVSDFVILNNGNVGVGTTNPGTFKLAVEGKIGAHEIEVTTNGWSDYVFEDDYKLKSLSETESYIKANKHLPGIPSEQEVKEKGVNLGEMQAKLLAKIEELTLHLIEQNKRIEKQNEEIAQLKTKVSGGRND